MVQSITIISGSALSILWGIAHIFPSRSVVSGFGTLSPDNRRIILMEWVSEGLMLIFMGVLPLLMLYLTHDNDPARLIVYRACPAMLLIMAFWTVITGSRTSIIPIKICPAIKSVIAVSFLTGSYY